MINKVEIYNRWMKIYKPLDSNKNAAKSELREMIKLIQEYYSWEKNNEKKYKDSKRMESFITPSMLTDKEIKRLKTKSLQKLGQKTTIPNSAPISKELVEKFLVKIARSEIRFILDMISSHFKNEQLMYLENNHGITLDDIISNGIIGYMNGLKKYSVEKTEFKMNTICEKYIFAEIKKNLELDTNPVHQSRLHLVNSAKINRFKTRYATEHDGKIPAVELISIATGINEEQVYMYEDSVARGVSMSFQLDENITVGDTIHQDLGDIISSFERNDEGTQNDIRRISEYAKNTDNRKEEIILKMLLGLDGYNPLIQEMNLKTAKHMFSKNIVIKICTEMYKLNIINNSIIELDRNEFDYLSDVIDYCKDNHITFKDYDDISKEELRIIKIMLTESVFTVDKDVWFEKTYGKNIVGLRECHITSIWKYNRNAYNPTNSTQYRLRKILNGEATVTKKATDTKMTMIYKQQEKPKKTEKTENKKEKNNIVQKTFSFEI